MPFLSGKQAFPQTLEQKGVDVMKTAGVAPARARDLAPGGPYFLDGRMGGSFRE